jgi:hypothetical protein
MGLKSLPVAKKIGEGPLYATARVKGRNKSTKEEGTKGKKKQELM